MAIDLVVASLLRIPLFAGLKPLQITEIGRRAQRCAFCDGEVITQAGEPGDGAFLILSGTAGRRAAPGDRAALEPVEPGSLLGELALFIDHAYGATIVAQGWVDCLKLERTTLAEQMREDPDIADRLAGVIRGRLSLVAAELQAIDQLLLSSIDLTGQLPPALPPPRSVPAAARLAQ
jgi:CRP-like cAMP-binding protein